MYKNTETRKNFITTVQNILNFMCTSPIAFFKSFNTSSPTLPRRFLKPLHEQFFTVYITSLASVNFNRGVNTSNAAFSWHLRPTDAFSLYQNPNVLEHYYLHQNNISLKLKWMIKFIGMFFVFFLSYKAF